MKPSRPNPRAKSARPAAAPAAKRRGNSNVSVPPIAPIHIPTPELQRVADETNALVAAVPFNARKPAELGLDNALAPPEGDTVELASTEVAASTLSEANVNTKTGPGAVDPVAPSGALTAKRANSGGQTLTTNQGVAVSDNQHSLKAGLRGPTLLEDFVLREKITHFDHERIPERIVHARGSAAHGIFECYKPLDRLTRAAPFSAAGKVTPVFVRFSTVAGERGSTDTARDVRGFAVKFYTDEGNWDLVGNNIPVFFIQDAMKFPDLIHAVKPEPHNAIPQAASAHDTFWDFVSLMPESTHMLMWVMSDRGIPRSLRMMQGFGVHTFRLINSSGESVFCKFHWKPLLGTHSLVWDEAVKISGADPDFHRRDLWDAIEAGQYPQWELGLQVFSEEQAEGFSFDVLDSTKIVPEELVPIRYVGKLTLNRNPDNFFAETEQVAFCTAHVVPGIDFSNDPLLHGRIHSYIDTQITRLGGANFHEIPINAPIAPIHNNQRDGLHRQAIPRGRVAYEPNSLGGGCPFQAGAKGFVSFAPSIAENNDPVDRVRGKPEKFGEHYNQARLFFDSQTPVEQAHIIGGFRFELSKLTVPAIRQRMVSSLRNVSDALAGAVAEGLGIELPDPMPRALERVPKPEVGKSKALSLHALPGDGGIATRKIAILIAKGADAASLRPAIDKLKAEHAVPYLVGVRIGQVQDSAGDSLLVDSSFENSPSVLFDAVIVPAGDVAGALLKDGRAADFIKEQYRHCKTIWSMGDAAELMRRAAIEPAQDDPGVLQGSGRGTLDRFIAAVAQHRHPERDSDPPPV